MKRLLFCLLSLSVIFLHSNAQNELKKPIRLAVAGMTHGHISFILGRPDKGDFKLVGVSDSNKELTDELAVRYKLPHELVYNKLEKMLNETKPEVVVAFGSVYSNLEVVQACAPRGIHVMAEKPLATNRQNGLFRGIKWELKCSIFITVSANV